MKTGKIIAFEGPGKPFVLQVHNVRDIGAYEILVKNLYTTICGSDLHTYSGVRKEACPTVLGHEIVGRIEDIGTSRPCMDNAGQSLKKGDIITWSVFSSDAQSLCALRGIPQKGDDLFKYGHRQISGDEIFHGGLADYCILKKGTAVLKLPNEMPLPVAATINCAIATVAGGLRLAGNMKGKTVLITGMGLLGIACAAMCREAGALWITAADINDHRLQPATSFGASETLNIINEATTEPEKIKDRFAGKGVDVVFDMSGAADAMHYGLNALGIGGTAVWIGAVFKTDKIQVDAEKMIRNINTIKGLHNYNFEDFKYAVDFMSANWDKYPFGTVVSREFPLAETEDAFKYALENRPFRVGIKI